MDGKPLTGRKVLLITVGAFAIIIGVNVLMAVQAVRTFPGLEVANSYVASQVFDRERRAQEALGWVSAVDYRPGALRLSVTGADGRPAGLSDLAVTVGRPTVSRDDMVPAFVPEDGAWVAPVTLAPGRWVVMLTAKAADGTAYRKRLELSVRAGG